MLQRKVFIKLNQGLVYAAFYSLLTPGEMSSCHIFLMLSFPQTLEYFRVFFFLDGELKTLTLPASATKISIPELSPGVDYTVSIAAFQGSEESLPVSGQITRESHTSKQLLQMFRQETKAAVTDRSSTETLKEGQSSETGTCVQVL